MHSLSKLHRNSNPCLSLFPQTAPRRLSSLPNCWAGQEFHSSGPVSLAGGREGEIKTQIPLQVNECWTQETSLSKTGKGILGFMYLCILLPFRSLSFFSTTSSHKNHSLSSNILNDELRKLPHWNSFQILFMGHARKTFILLYIQIHFLIKNQFPQMIFGCVQKGRYTL